MAIIDDHVRATDYRREAALHSLLRVSPGGHTRACSHASLAAAGAAYLEVHMSWLLDQILAQTEVATFHAEAYCDGDYASRSVGCPYIVRYEILASLCTHQRSQAHFDHCCSYKTLHNCCDLLDPPFLAVFRCRSWSKQVPAYALREVALTCEFGIPAACHNKHYNQLANNLHFV
jgi:hypothetical protein